MSTAKLMKATAALSDIASEPGVTRTQKLASLHAFIRHAEGLVRKLEGEAPNPVSQAEGS